MQNIIGCVMNDASAGLPVQDMEPQTVIAFENDHVPHGTFAAEKRRGISRSRFADRDPLSVFVLSAAADTVVGNSRMVCFSDSISSCARRSRSSRAASSFLDMNMIFGF